MDLQQLGPYRIDGFLGKGGMGAVYGGVHESTGEEVAIKVLATSVVDDERFRERFRNEIETLKQLHHPNIVKLIGYGEEHGAMYYVMELVKGKSLYDEQRSGRRFNAQEVVHLGVQICRGLKHAHDVGVIHRDLKPANLLLEAESGQIKITDFGIAKLFGSSHHTAEGAVIGTADYMSPEQAEGKRITARSDLFSLGCVLYALLVGKSPFAAKTVPEVLHKLCYTKAPSLLLDVPHVPEELEAIVQQLLNKDPADRIATALLAGNRIHAMEHALSVETRLENSPAATEDLDLEALDTPVPKLPTERGLSGTVEIVPPADDFTMDELGGGDSGVKLAATEMASSATVAEQAPEKSSSARPTHKFTTVEEELLRSLTREDRAEEDGFDWVKITAAIGLIVLVLGCAVAIWRSLQPEPADQLLQTIINAHKQNGVDGLRDVDREMEMFLADYPQHPQNPAIQLFLRDLQSHRLHRRLERSCRRQGGLGHLEPAEQFFVKAMRLKESSGVYGPYRAEAERLFADIAFYFSEFETKPTRACIEMAEHELTRLRAVVPSPAPDHTEAVQAMLEDLESKTASEDLGEFYSRTIDTFREFPWAAEIVRKLEGKQAKLKEE
ncbi:MAG: serine/threonine protein kinase [Pirellulaceae bacterium]|nr:serine/threonine protein kinase [Pirellulaceae bacterium]